MNITWFTRSVYRDGQYCIRYRAPDGTKSQTLWYKDLSEAGKQMQQIKDDWRANERMAFLTRETG